MPQKSARPRAPRSAGNQGIQTPAGLTRGTRAPSASGRELTRGTNTFPPAWTWLVDEALPEWVKQNYSPRDSWKDKPFAKEDARFFFKGIEDLSSLFTEERPGKLPEYFAHPKYRSAYLLYFLPLQAAKFLTLFNLHPPAIEAALDHGRKRGKLRVADLGAGPGTASIALLLWILGYVTRNRNAGEIPPIELTWLDVNESTMRDGKALVERLANAFPKLRGKVTLTLHEAPWWEANRFLPEETSLILFGNVLNEAHLPASIQNRPEGARTFWGNLLARAQGGGLLFLEPAARRSSQLLSQLRDQLLREELIEAEPTSIWGPCPHAGNCPLAEGRDWCHFSVPVQIPGQWFREFSKGLGSERQWAKFSYAWFSSPEYRAPKPDPSVRLVISDPLRKHQPGVRMPTAEVLICEPDHPGRITVRSSPQGGPYRGDLVPAPEGRPRPTSIRRARDDEG